MGFNYHCNFARFMLSVRKRLLKFSFNLVRNIKNYNIYAPVQNDSFHGDIQIQIVR